MSYLEGLYQRRCEVPSDINEHLPTLRRLASRCDHVTEMGMRGAVSTTALLVAQPKRFVSWDIDAKAVVSQNVADLVVLAGQTVFQPRVGNTLEIEIEETDLLFIDTLHTAAQLKAELARHGSKVRSWIALHDTMTFGLRGEDGKEPGLRAAIADFQRNNFPLWGVVGDYENNNGLVVLEHVRVPDAISWRKS
jgi:hypothetical protein